MRPVQKILHVNSYFINHFEGQNGLHFKIKVFFFNL